jgi:hypothetical protein
VPGVCCPLQLTQSCTKSHVHVWPDPCCRQLAGKPKILDSVREVVGINKERYVFPLRLNVTKASGTGSDAMFMGALLVSPLRHGQPAGTRPVNKVAWPTALTTASGKSCCSSSFSTPPHATCGFNVQSPQSHHTNIPCLASVPWKPASAVIWLAAALPVQQQLCVDRRACCRRGGACLMPVFACHLLLPQC